LIEQTPECAFLSSPSFEPINAIALSKLFLHSKETKEVNNRASPNTNKIQKAHKFFFVQL
jgi:hypothetical protein